MSDASALANRTAAIRSNEDAFIADYILTHSFANAPTSVGSIGVATDEDVVVLRHLLQPEANLVVLNSDYAGHSSAEISRLGRTAVADLAQAERWPNLLDALALQSVGVVGIDARWAARIPDIWRSVSRYLAARRCVAYFRGVFDYRDAESSMALLKSLSAVDNVLPLAATRNGSLWVCCDEGFYNELRDGMLGSGIFESGNSKTGPVFVSSKYARGAGDLFAVASSLPQAIYTVGENKGEDLQLLRGWHNPEPDGCWTDGNEADLAVRSPAGAPSDGELHLVANAWLPAGGGVQTIEITTDPAKERWTSVPLNVDEIVTIVTPYAATDAHAGTIDASIRISNPGRPSDYGANDSRVLGLKVRSVRLYPAYSTASA